MTQQILQYWKNQENVDAYEVSMQSMLWLLYATLSIVSFIVPIWTWMYYDETWSEPEPLTQPVLKVYLNYCIECKMKGSHLRLTRKMPYEIVCWNSEGFTLQCFTLVHLVVADSDQLQRFKIGNLALLAFAKFCLKTFWLVCLWPLWLPESDAVDNLWLFRPPNGILVTHRGKFWISARRELSGVILSTSQYCGIILIALQQ